MQGAAPPLGKDDVAPRGERRRMGGVACFSRAQRARTIEGFPRTPSTHEKLMVDGVIERFSRVFLVPFVGSIFPDGMDGHQLAFPLQRRKLSWYCIRNIQPEASFWFSAS